MATRFAAREVLVLATEDDCSVGLTARIERGLMERSVLMGAVAHGVSRSIKFSQIFCVCFIVFLYMSAGCVSTIRT